MDNYTKDILRVASLIVVSLVFGCGAAVVPVVEEAPKVVPTTEPSQEQLEEWKNNKIESTRRYEIWDKWRNENYEYMYVDKELRVRLSTLYRSEYYIEDPSGSTNSMFELLVQNLKDDKVTIILPKQNIVFLIDGISRLYGEFEGDRTYHLEPSGSYDKTGKIRTDQFIVTFQQWGQLTEEDNANIENSGSDLWPDGILDKNLLSLLTDDGIVNIKLNDALSEPFQLKVNPSWNGLPFPEDKELHEKIALNIEGVMNRKDWVSRKVNRESIFLDQLRSLYIGGKNLIEPGK